MSSSRVAVAWAIRVGSRSVTANRLGPNRMSRVLPAIVPHDVLHGVPLHAVEVDGRPLVERNQSGLVGSLLDRPTTLVGPAATIARMSAAVRGGASVLHIACHGEFDPEQPERSRVLLAADGTTTAS